MWPRKPQFGSLYRAFRYNGVRYIEVFIHTNSCNFAGSKKIPRYNRDFVNQGSFYWGSTVRASDNQCPYLLSNGNQFHLVSLQMSHAGSKCKVNKDERDKHQPSF